MIREFTSRLRVQVYIDFATLVSRTGVSCVVESTLDLGDQLSFCLEHDNTIAEMNKVISDLLRFPPIPVEINVNGYLFLPRQQQTTLGSVLNMRHR